MGMTTTDTKDMTFTVQFTADYFVLTTTVNLEVSKGDYEDNFDSLLDQAIEQADNLIKGEYGFSPTEFANDIVAESVIEL